MFYYKTSQLTRIVLLAGVNRWRCSSARVLVDVIVAAITSSAAVSRLAVIGLLTVILLLLWLIADERDLALDLAFFGTLILACLLALILGVAAQTVPKVQEAFDDVLRP